ncbi:hypothetical protein GCM10027160_29240 [Streptomyces calidiresistens]|uniref:Uncharacterized protein n=1 Tax=Streptomyces calidiresistens TaxID=1485586 RepID=A0A7W3T209_9ACTN|nr:hypothetical protein [Streptomyces calidiresistens]MBB0229489.1 hypothetical protein [Streptomyces calidiresistens]
MITDLRRRLRAARGAFLEPHRGPLTHSARAALEDLAELHPGAPHAALLEDALWHRARLVRAFAEGAQQVVIQRRTCGNCPNCEESR